MTVAWGQNAANGELGLGPDEPKSATKPTRHAPLNGIEVIECVVLPFIIIIITFPYLQAWLNEQHCGRTEYDTVPRGY